jgi:hypothetical protein
MITVTWFLSDFQTELSMGENHMKGKISEMVVPLKMFRVVLMYILFVIGSIPKLYNFFVYGLGLGRWGERMALWHILACDRRQLMVTL